MDQSQMHITRHATHTRAPFSLLWRPAPQALIWLIGEGLPRRDVVHTPINEVG